MVHPNMCIVYYIILSLSPKTDIRYLLKTNKINYRKPDENMDVYFFMPSSITAIMIIYILKKKNILPA